MESYFYLLSLAVSLTGLVVCDWRWRLAFFYDAVLTLKVIALGMALFVVWDLLGIALGIFFEGDSRYVSGISLAPELPIEELFFLALLCYVALLIWRVASRLHSARGTR